MSSPATSPQPETATPGPAITNRSSKPQGVIPKNLQSWVWIGIALIVAVGIFFSGTPKQKATAGAAAAQTPTQPPSAGGLTPEQVAKRLQDSEEAARRNGVNTVPPADPPQPGDPRYNPDAAFLAANQPPAAPAHDSIEEEQRKREYFGRYASNVALSYRPEARPANGPASNPQLAPAGLPGLSGLAESASMLQNGLPALPANFQQQLDSSLKSNQQQLTALQQQLDGATNPNQVTPAATTATPAAVTVRKTANTANSSAGRMHLIFEGTVLECVLVNRLNGDFAGPVITQVTTDLYSHDHSTVLIPSGSRVLGETRKVDAFGQERLAVVFHRLIMPDGYAVDFDQAPGLNQIGETALKDKVNNHYFKIFGASIAVGALAGLATIGTNNSAVTGLPVSSTDAYRQGVASSLSQSSLQILNKFLNIPPTLTIREGHRVRIFLLQDLQVPAYANHTMPSDL